MNDEPTTTVAKSASVRSEHDDVVTQPTAPPSRVLVIILLLSAVAQMDSGIIPPALSIVQSQFSLDFTDKGLLGACRLSHSTVHNLNVCCPSIVVLVDRAGAVGPMGFIASCPVWGVLLGSTSDQRQLMTVCAWMMTAALFCNSIAPDFNSLLAARFFVGVFQAPMIIYAPVWSDRFAGPNQKTLWMALIQSCR